MSKDHFAFQQALDVIPYQNTFLILPLLPPTPKYFSYFPPPTCPKHTLPETQAVKYDMNSYLGFIYLLATKHCHRLAPLENTM